MRKILSVLATAVLVLQSMGTSLVYAVEPVDGNDGGESVTTVESVENSIPEEPKAEEPAEVAEPAEQPTEVTEPVDEPEVPAENEEPADETPAENAEQPAAEVPAENGEDPAEVTEPVDEPEVPAENEEPADETPAENAEELAEVTEPAELEKFEKLYMPDFNIKFMEPALKAALNVDNPEGACDDNSTTTCIKDPVHTVGSLDNPGDVQITKVVEKTDIDGEYKITVEVKGNPVETVEATQNNICAVVVFDRSGSMGKGDKVEVCTEGYAPGECKEYYNFLNGGYPDHCARFGGFLGLSCQEYECRTVAGEGECKTSAQEYKKRVDAVAGAKLFATTLNNSLNHQGGDNMAKIGLVTFAGEATVGRNLDFADLSNGEFGNHDGGTNLDAGLLKAQEMLGDEFCNTENSKKYIVAITDGAPTYAGVGNERIGRGGNSSILEVTPKTTEDAQAIRDSGIEIFTIGYQLEEINEFDTANYLKNSIASFPNYAYEGADADKVAQAFQTISESIQEFAAGSEATLIDHIGNVTLVTSDENQTPNELKDFTITKDGQIIEFYVKIKDGAADGDYDTNDGVYLTYTGYDENGTAIPGKELSIEESSKIHWVQPGCGGDEPVIVEGVTVKGASTYPRKWNEAGDALESVGYSEWTYVEATESSLNACEWTCNGEGYVRNGNTCVLATYTVTFYAEDGKTVLSSSGYEYNTPAANVVTPEAPEKEETAEYTYTFAGWNPEVEDVTADADYVATYTAHPRLYTVTFYAEDGKTVLSSSGYEYNTPAANVVTPEAPEKEETAEYTYTFAGRNPEVEDVTADAEYVATYSSRVNQYTITFVDEDGESVLKEATQYAYGTPAADIVAPEKVESHTGADHKVYTFAGWNPAIAEVTGDATYTATYEALGDCEEGYHSENVSSDGTAGEAGSDLTNGSDDVITVNADAGDTEIVCRPNQEEKKCDQSTLPTNAQAVTDTYVQTWSNGAWSTEPRWELKGDGCTYKCKDGFHLNANNGCERNSGGGGSSGGGHHDDDEEIELGGQVSDKCSISGTNLSAEEIEAYLYACENDITTIRDINEARLGDYLNRAEMAKIVSVFATKELGMKPNTSKDCSNFEGSMNGWSKEMRDYMVMSCQLELMGIHTVNYEAIPDFMPAKHVSRAEFGTILSRILWGDKYEGTNDNYYFRHLDALKANKIITNIDPTITEYRSWVLLMIYRSVAVIKAGGTRKTDSIEQEVTEELQNSTGAIAEIEAATGALIGMPNPASVYCEEQGGTVDLDTSKCKLADGTEVDEWEYYNANHSDESAEAETGTTIGMPNPAAVYCEEKGGTVDLDSGKCKLADGTEVDQWEYYRENNPEAETGDTTD